MLLTRVIRICDYRSTDSTAPFWVFTPPVSVQVPHEFILSLYSLRFDLDVDPDLDTDPAFHSDADTEPDLRRFRNAFKYVIKRYLPKKDYFKIELSLVVHSLISVPASSDPCHLPKVKWDLNLQNLFGLHVHCCTQWLVRPPTPIWAHIRGRYWSAKIDDISLWPPSPRLPYYYTSLFVTGRRLPILDDWGRSESSETQGTHFLAPSPTAFHLFCEEYHLTVNLTVAVLKNFTPWSEIKLAYM